MREKLTIIEDRAEAIKMAIEELEGEEILIILGKGDELTQEINGKFLPFDDREVIRSILA